ncbi:hypothetical protein RHGRI_028187 [Rhododendron griersonianum]|uniref:Uncharacterized protein n=1 Tax=Rhododendron griersonianum TaxID=479676 RepID=A0AAV6IIQ9_9ERIC|nr:hypothetical protein RHGRI_028187 [Rhododendron griersonianum]
MILTAEEKKRFQRAVASGELSKLIEPWEPWWLKPSARTISLSREGTQLVQPLSNEETLTSTRHGPESDPAQDIPPGRLALKRHYHPSTSSAQPSHLR